MSAAGDATIRYTTDGSEPSCAAGTEYTTPITLPVRTALSLRAVRCMGTRASAVATASYLNAPVFVGSHTPPDGGLDIRVAGNYAYLAVGTSGLQVIDVSNTAAPQLTGSRGCCTFSVDHFGNYAYSTTGGTINVIDVSNPASPSSVGSTTPVGNSATVSFSGTHAYVADNNGLLHSVNVSNPMAPVVVDSYNFRTSPPNDAASNPDSVHVIGNYAYVADLNGHNLLVVDISNPASMSLAGSLDPAGGSLKRGVYVVGTTAYMTDSAGANLRVIDVSNPAAPVQLGSANPAGSLRRRVFASGSYAFVTTDASGFQIYNVSNPAAPVFVGEDTTAGAGQVRAIFVSGKYAYLAGYTFLRIYQVFP